ncbi:hypothetical protein DFR55_11522 [Herbinix hemicellulosilytica]|uniref:Uncharacterized protein n=1 Tax=Herbinix hemicellulosilytica TaxID=1564487 RepID=A0A0H5SKB1_HERHM|nr:hypothetical protein [Herbinix hemicellulosilytica]RBP58046.1 hypothetical protein DFR55_11522 [Herbinix hemicellulosilytica]CRZ35530.1 hypothetical protein HHT355_2341 [Herbinix hemicellulosilytica]
MSYTVYQGRPETYFVCYSCINTSRIRFKTADLTRKVLPAIGHEPTYVNL